MKFSQSKISKEKWFSFNSREQLLHIATELSRIASGELRYKRNNPIVRRAYERALDLIDITIEDLKWRERLNELFSLRDGVAALYIGKTDPAIVNTLSILLEGLSKTN